MSLHFNDELGSYEIHDHGHRVSLLFNDLKDAATFHRVRGSIDGIPSCCVEEFVSDLTVRGWLPYVRRGDESLDFVPCSVCQRDITAVP